MSRSRKKNPYRASRRFDKTCRCHGGCPYCLSNRMHATARRLASFCTSRDETAYLGVT